MIFGKRLAVTVEEVPIESGEVTLTDKERYFPASSATTRYVVFVAPEIFWQFMSLVNKPTVAASFLSHRYHCNDDFAVGDIPVVADKT